MTDKFKESLRFVVKYYRPDAFRPNPDLFRFPMPTLPVSRPWWRRTSVAAAIAVGVLAASAFLYYELTPRETAPALPERQEQPMATAPEPKPETSPSKRIEFKDTPLPKVAEAIANTYGVEITGIRPGDTTRLTLSYEGTAEDLIDTINELLGTRLRIVKADKAAGTDTPKPQAPQESEPEPQAPGDTGKEDAE